MCNESLKHVPTGHVLDVVWVIHQSMKNSDQTENEYRFPLRTGLPHFPNSAVASSYPSSVFISSLQPNLSTAEFHCYNCPQLNISVLPKAAAVDASAPQAVTVNYSTAASPAALTWSAGADEFLICSVIPESPSASEYDGLLITLLCSQY